MKLGLVPVFVDCRIDNYTIDVDLILSKITNRTRAIIVTHIFGQPADMDAIVSIAREKGLKVIEDCAHALGAQYNGKRIGGLGDASIFSFGTGKNLPCFGGGMVTTNDGVLFKKIEMNILLSKPPSLGPVLKKIIETFISYLLTVEPVFTLFTFPIIKVLNIFDMDIMDFEKKENIPDALVSGLRGLPLRIANIQAAYGSKQLKDLDSRNCKRIENAKLFNKLLGLTKSLSLPSMISGQQSVFTYFYINVKQRYLFRKQLLKRGVDTSKKSFIFNCSSHPDFKRHASNSPVAQALEDSLIEIPNNNCLGEYDIRRICNVIENSVNACYD
jgi:dTDP-4-amino-4,6-dideoxygalactose transaminase